MCPSRHPVHTSDPADCEHASVGPISRPVADALQLAAERYVVYGFQNS
jgi:hypothetical protein